MSIQAVIDVATREVGYVESGGPGGNSGNITKYWAELLPSFQGQPWCAVFVSWVFLKAGVKLPPAPYSWGYTYVGALTDLARKSGWVIPKPRPGAIVNFGTKHTEVCISEADAAGNFWTIGGNTSPNSSGSQVNGGGVYKRLRNINGSGIAPCTFIWPPVYQATPTTSSEDLDMAIISVPYVVKDVCNKPEGVPVPPVFGGGAGGGYENIYVSLSQDNFPHPASNWLVRAVGIRFDGSIYPLAPGAKDAVVAVPTSRTAGWRLAQDTASVGFALVDPRAGKDGQPPVPVINALFEVECKTRAQ